MAKSILGNALKALIVPQSRCVAASEGSKLLIVTPHGVRTTSRSTWLTWLPTSSTAWAVFPAAQYRRYHAATGTELRHRAVSRDSLSLLKDRVCSVTAVDFSEQRVERQELDNETLQAYLDTRRPDWSRCRWISVNGLSTSSFTDLRWKIWSIAAIERRLTGTPTMLLVRRKRS